MKAIHTLLIFLISTVIMAQGNQQPTVDVTGEGIINVIPDEVILNVRVENTGKNVKELKQQNDFIVNEVLLAVKSMGIDNKDVQTEYIRLSKNYEYNSKTYNFVANQAITILVKDLSKYESLVNGLMDSGINRIDGIQFSSSMQAELESQARKKAMDNARKKAIEYAGALDQTIGKAISISEYMNDIRPQPMYKAMAMESDMSSGQQTLAPGELEIRVNVNVRFLLN